jgi:chromosome partitioning protein
MALVITVAQQKGGSGKTSLAAHLCVAWANPQCAEDRTLAAARKVIALDLDPQESLSKWFEVRRQSLVGSEALEVRGAAGWRLTGELIRAKREADIVVLDLPPGVDNSVVPAFRAADLVVVPLQLSPMDFWATAPVVDLAKKSGAHPLLVLNRVPARASLNDVILDKAKSAGWPVARASLGNRVLFAASLLDGKGVTEDAPSSLAAAELRLLAREVMTTTRTFARAA